jgi:hypothetical protein
VKKLSSSSLVAWLGHTSLRCFSRVFFKTLIAPDTVRKYVCFYNLTQLLTGRAHVSIAGNLIVLSSGTAIL